MSVATRAAEELLFHEEKAPTAGDGARRQDVPSGGARRERSAVERARALAALPWRTVVQLTSVRGLFVSDVTGHSAWRAVFDALFDVAALFVDVPALPDARKLVAMAPELAQFLQGTLFARAAAQFEPRVRALARDIDAFERLFEDASALQQLAMIVGPHAAYSITDRKSVV